MAFSRNGKSVSYTHLDVYKRQVLLQKYIPTYGKMKKVLSDQGVQFQSKKLERTLRENGIQPILSSVRHPQGNLAERVNKELGKYL